MTPLHQRLYSDIADGTVLTARAKQFSHLGGVLLPMGGSHEQGFSNKCGAAAVWNTLETCNAWLDEPLPSVNAIYQNARLLAGARPHDQGSFLAYCAEAVCQLLDGAAKWMVLPTDPQIMAAWLAVERTGIAYGMDWTAGHGVSRMFGNNILFPNHDTVAPGHAVSINGWEQARSFRSGFLWTKRKTAPVFAIENTHQNTSTRYYIQAAEVPVFGRSAIVFVPPEYT